MDRTMILDAYDPQCPIRNILARMSDKWSLLVIYTLSQIEKCVSVIYDEQSRIFHKRCLPLH